MINFRILRRRLYKAAQHRGGRYANSRFDTSDIVQESLLQLLRETEDNGLAVELVNETYLQKVSLGNATRLLRDNLAQKRNMNSEVEGLEADRFAVGDADPQDIVTEQDSLGYLIQQIGKLESGFQTVLYRRVIDQASFVDLAKEFGTTVDVVRTIYKNAIRALKRNMNAA